MKELKATLSFKWLDKRIEEEKAGNHCITQNELDDYKITLLKDFLDGFSQEMIKSYTNQIEETNKEIEKYKAIGDNLSLLRVNGLKSLVDDYSASIVQYMNILEIAKQIPNRK